MTAAAATADTNVARATIAWGADMPRWVAQLAVACDRTSQRAVAGRLDVSSGYVSRLINRSYAGSYPEAERKVLSILAADLVECPLAGRIALKTCLRNRRRKTPAINVLHRAFDARCPSCPHNTDIEED